MPETLPITPRHRPELDPEFVPALLWVRAYGRLVSESSQSAPLTVALEQADGTVTRSSTRVLPHTGAARALNLRHVERWLKFLLWQQGGWRAHLDGDPHLVAELAAIYHPEGRRAFDHEFMGDRIYGKPFTVVACPTDRLPPTSLRTQALGRHWEGCRIGFDLGGSDRKCAAVIDGVPVFTEEVKWSPYFERDPAYHLEGVRQSILSAARHLPRIDAIGGSAAGVYINNRVRVASLFRGVPPEAFEAQVRPMFEVLRKEFGGVPFEVANDGEVTALAGSMSLGTNSVLGYSLGTSVAGGYVTPDGGITSWLNELAFVPVDYRWEAPVDEWSGDRGCGVQYFSQQAVARLAPKAGFEFSPEVTLPERLERVQEALRDGHDGARAVFSTIGTCFGYAVAHLSEYYDFRHLLVLGRVSSGEGGELILQHARQVLADEFPEIAERIQLVTPDETSKRHGQAVAAASLPPLPAPGAS